MAVVMQAMQWGMNPFAVAQKTHIVNGQLGYEAQLVNAVVQGSNAIKGAFHYEYKGASPAMECRVGAVLRGDSAITWGEWLNENKVTTKNSPLWKTNPKQQLGYLQVKNWARLYTPGAILGVYTPDEFDQPQPRNMGSVDILPQTPVEPSVLEAAQAAATEGVAIYSKFWKDTGAANRKAIGAAEHERLKAVALEADKARTVTTPPPATGPSFDTVMKMLNEAETMDALFDAGNMIDQVDDDDQRKTLDEKFEERKFVLEVS
jgi:hypothetical protein